MREIKFRAWHKKRKEYAKILSIHFLEGIEEVTLEFEDEMSITIAQFDFQEVILEQELEEGYYEGDILFDDHYEEYLQIKWCKEHHRFVIAGDNYEDAIEVLSDFDVVGNIHENKELLK